MKCDNLQEIMFNTSDSPIPSGSYGKPAVDEAIQELKDALKASQEQCSKLEAENKEMFSDAKKFLHTIATLEEQVRKVILNSAKKQQESLEFEQALADKIKELQSNNAIQWYDIQAELPEAGKLVLVYSKNDDTYNVAYRKGGKDLEWRNSEQFYPANAFTHWTKIPKYLDSQSNITA